MIAGDQARASVFVRVEAAEAFRVFTEEIDQWWRRGPKYRTAGRRRGMLLLEAGVGGRLFETFETADGELRSMETGRVTVWKPPQRLVFEWRQINFAPDEKTEVEVVFLPRAHGTLVTVTHRGWAAIRGDHPARHRLDVPAFIRMQGLWWGALLTALREHTD